MRLTEGFTYVTRDPRWFKKVFIGALVTAFPFVEAITDGYQIQTIRNIRAGHPRPLPEWDDVSGFFRRGIGLRLAIYAIYIPTIITMVLALLLNFASIYNWLFVEDRDTGAAISLLGTLGRWVAIPLIDLLVLLLVPVVLLIVPALARRLADGHGVLSLLNPLPTLRLIFANFGPYVLSRVSVFVLLTLVTVVTSVVGGAGSVILIGPIVGWFLLAAARFWSRMMWAYYLAHMSAPWEARAPRAPAPAYPAAPYAPNAPRP